MGIGKAFKKAGKKLKKGAKKATGAVKDAAKDVEKGVDKGIDAAKDVAKDAGKGLDAAVADVEKLGNKTAALAEDAYEDALRAGEAAWNATVDALERWLVDDLADILLDAAMDIYKSQRKLIDSMLDAGRALIVDPKASAEFERMVTSAAGKKRDAGAHDSVRALVKIPEIQAITKYCGKYDTLSLGLASSAAYGIGAEGCFGYGATLPDAKTIGGFFGVGGVAVSVGGAVTAQLGTWNVKPADFKGPYFAATLEVEVEGGGGISIVFPLPASEADWLNLVTGKTKPGPCGIVVFVGGGGEVSACVSGGQTWVF